MAQTRGRCAQVVLTEQEYDLLVGYAAETKQSVSDVIRQALRKAVIIDLEQRRKRQAVARLARGDTPSETGQRLRRKSRGCEYNHLRRHRFRPHPAYHTHRSAIMR